MSYTSFEFYLFLAVTLCFYYTFPLQMRWIALLAASAAFYMAAYRTGWWIVLATCLFSYGTGLLLQACSRYRKLVFAFAVTIVVLPWFCVKHGNFILGSVFGLQPFSWIVPLGISFYTLQIIAYLADIYKGDSKAEKNPAKYALFIFFFPQIIQGPIPRYNQLFPQLIQGHRFDERNFVKGCQLILWGFFLKLMIACRADIVVCEIFGHPQKYTGCYVLVGGILYSLELYTDFLACVKLSQGCASLFGINLAENFMRPYFACSIKEFWHRWHISLSRWLRDYIYIPLGGSKHGRVAKYRNLFLTFFISGAWHGAGYKFLFWGMLHACYQVAGSLSAPWKARIYKRIQMPHGIQKSLQQIGVFFWVMCAWILFRAKSLTIGISMLKSMFFVHNPWIFFNDKLLTLGLDWKEWCVLAISTAILFGIERRQEQGASIRNAVLKNPVFIRFTLYLAAFLTIMIFGTYGFGFDPKDFIYGGF